MQVLTVKAVAPQPDVETTRVTKAGDATRLLKQRDPPRTYASVLGHGAAQRPTHKEKQNLDQNEDQSKKGHQGPGKNCKINDNHYGPLKNTLI